MAQDIYVINKEISPRRIIQAGAMLGAADALLRGISADPEYIDEFGAGRDLYPNQIVSEIAALRKRIKAVASQLDDYARIVQSGPEALERIDADRRGQVTSWWERASHERSGMGQYFLKSNDVAAVIGLGGFRSKFHRLNVGLKALGVDTARIGGSHLDMREDQYDSGIYHADVGCWQKRYGYTDLYDKIFDLATDMEKRKYTFTYKGTEYIFWAWKGDYLNLGAGAELGIYYGGGPLWKADPSLSMDMSMSVKYRGGGEILSRRDTTWWITGFNSNPEYLNVDAKDLRVEFQVLFPEEDNGGMYEAFRDKCLKAYPAWKFEIFGRTATLVF